MTVAVARSLTITVAVVAALESAVYGLFAFMAFVDIFAPPFETTSKHLAVAFVKLLALACALGLYPLAVFAESLPLRRPALAVGLVTVLAYTSYWVYWLIAVEPNRY